MPSQSMTENQLQQIVDFCKPYYKATGRWHAWDHITGVQRLALAIAEEEYPDANKKALIAAATIHDMGRIIRDEGHAGESGKIAKPFLEAINIPKEEMDIILDAVVHHDVKEIDKSKTIEARIVFDADKIEILSVYGFMRVAFWLVEEREMELGEAVRFLWEYCGRFKTKLTSKYAKLAVASDLKLLESMIQSFNQYDKTWRTAT